ncbi:sugar phosphate isomerase/epimerase family protein [Salinarimonas soli]|uniref:TIM barrel protein n=1 Tax=Salinarimonas soli TaxID=1638099 RepID=A0A5B2VY64_9HYPH|nr:TIM barrel protein [Salinarimonas soli]KAA2244331.1 TIM barrel protein [Salinarimonas soli]
MSLGLNLSFCVKRWVTPALWAPLVASLGVRRVQLTYDLVDPLWPDDLLDDLARAVRDEAGARGIEVHSAFIGLAHYTYNQLLHPEPRVRDAAERWMARAYRFAARAGIAGVGGPVGAMAAAPDGREPEAVGERDYADLVRRLRRLAEIASAEGLTELYAEPTPLRREWPFSIAQAERLSADLAGSAVPWRYCLDWGHATMAPAYGERDASLEPWLTRLKEHVGVIHLQQTDGILDRHWDFTEAGIVDPMEAARLHERAGLADVPVFLEVFYPFEMTDAEVLDRIRRTCAILEPAFPSAAPR